MPMHVCYGTCAYASHCSRLRPLSPSQCALSCSFPRPLGHEAPACRARSYDDYVSALCFVSLLKSYSTPLHLP